MKIEILDEELLLIENVDGSLDTVMPRMKVANLDFVDWGSNLCP